MAALSELYKQAAKKAFDDNVSAADEPLLVNWIRHNCRYKADNEFYLVLGIGCELAALESQSRGYENNIHEAFVKAETATCRR